MPGRIGTVGFVAPGLRLVCHREARLAGLMSLRLQIALFDGFDEIDVLDRSRSFRSPASSWNSRRSDEPRILRSMLEISLSASSVLDTCDGIIVPGGGWGNNAEHGAWGEVARGRAACTPYPAGTDAAVACLRLLRRDDPCVGWPAGRPPSNHQPRLL